MHFFHITITVSRVKYFRTFSKIRNIDNFQGSGTIYRMKTLKNTLVWGVVLWFIGYVLGFVLFPFVSPALIGWIITPIGILITVLVLVKKIHRQTIGGYFAVACIWTLIAIVLDYFFLVKLLHPADGYYKLDVYLYYSVTFLLPLLIGWYKTAHTAPQGTH